jgi:polyisoprenoid-binding protein YceI
MRRLRTFALVFALATASPAFAAPVAYAIDANHTQVLFTYSHFGLSNITGRLGDVTGTFAFDADDPAASSIAVAVPMASLSMGVPKLDDHLKSADFFDVATHPTATFTSTRVTAAGPGRLAVAGDLTIHGVTRPVVLDVTINRIGEHPMSKTPAVGFDATTTIRRSEFGVGRMVPNVGDEVRIRITLEARIPRS